MDVFLLACLGIGLIYCLFSAARWAFRIDSQTRRSGTKSKHRKRKPAEKAIDDAFFAIIRPLWKRPPDESDPR